MSYRCFAPADEKIAGDWAADPVAVDTWTLGAPIGRGEAGSFYGTSDKGCRSACKPAIGGDGTPRAAHERIASDLARALDLPVPAICLWTDPVAQSKFAVSAWAFPQALTWGEVATRLSATFMQNAAPIFSAARVFHSWIGDTDHNGNAGNVVVDITSTDDKPGIAFIDHAFSMSYNTNFSTLPMVPVNLSYVPKDLQNPAATEAMVAAINRLEGKMIENTVSRIPATFLPPDRAQAIIVGLLKRRGELERIFGVVAV